MEKHNKQRKRKFNFIKFLLVIIILYILGFGIYNLVMIPIKNILVFNNNYLSDQEILREAKIDNYPSFILTPSYIIKKRLMSNPYIKSVTVKKHFKGIVDLYIKEYKILFYDSNNKKIILENGKAIKDDIKSDSSILTNYVPDTYYVDLIKQMSKIKQSVLNKVSEIEYRPNEVDKERFLLTMNDGNYVYLTLYTFSKLNNYNNILSSLELKKGILYLDSGNYFDIIE